MLRSVSLNSTSLSLTGHTRSPNYNPGTSIKKTEYPDPIIAKQSGKQKWQYCCICSCSRAQRFRSACGLGENRRSTAAAEHGNHPPVDRGHTGPSVRFAASSIPGHTDPLWPNRTALALWMSILIVNSSFYEDIKRGMQKNRMNHARCQNTPRVSLWRDNETMKPFYKTNKCAEQKGCHTMTI